MKTQSTIRRQSPRKPGCFDSTRWDSGLRRSLVASLLGVFVATTPATVYAQQNSQSPTLAALEQLSGAPLVTSRSPFTGVPTYIGTKADHPMKVAVSPLAPAADGCDSNCTVTACGNGIVTSPEECDDGNLVGGDGGDASCNAVPLSYAMVANTASGSVTVFDTITDTVLGSVALGAANTLDCSIPSTATLGYVGNFANGIHVVDLAAVPPVLAGGTNPIVSSIATEDTSVTKNGQFLVSCNGGTNSPVSVMDLGSRTEVSTFRPVNAPASRCATTGPSSPWSTTAARCGVC